MSPLKSQKKEKYSRKRKISLSNYSLFRETQSRRKEYHQIRISRD